MAILAPAMKRFTNLVGAHVLPYANERVIAPPARIQATGQRNVIVCTPRRSGTHLAIDVILNNLPEFRKRPLYANLDPMLRNPAAHRDRLPALKAGAGIVIKTHFPLFQNLREETLRELDAVIEASVVVAVERNATDVARSLANWGAYETARNFKVGDGGEIEREFTDFWAFWRDRVDLVIQFTDLFKPEPVAQFLEVCRGDTVTDTIRTPRRDAPRSEIYVNKALTRLLGRRAPRIDTTIFTLRTPPLHTQGERS